MPKPILKLRDILGKDSALMRKYSLIEGNVTERGILEYTAHPFFTSHGLKHITFVEKIVDKLLPNNIKQNIEPIEVFILMCGILLHDIGMIPEAEETLEHTRDVHNIRSREIITKYYSDIGLDKVEAEIIGDVCYAHRDHISGGMKVITLDEIKKNPYQIGLAKIRGNFLASLIRLADELDIDYSRAPEFIQKISKPGKHYKKHWDTHNAIAGVDIDSLKWKIEVKPMKPTSVESIQELYQSINIKKIKIQRELDSIRQREFFQNNGIDYSVIDVDWENFLIFAKDSITPQVLQQKISVGKEYLYKIKLVDGGWGGDSSNNFRILNTCEVILSILQSPNLKIVDKEIICEALDRIFKSQCRSDSGFPSITYDTFTSRCSSSTECTSWVVYICLTYSKLLRISKKDEINNAVKWLVLNFDKNNCGWGLWLGEPIRLYPSLWAMRALNRSKTISNKNYEQYLINILGLHSSNDEYLFGFYPNSESNVAISSLFLTLIDEIKSTRNPIYQKYKHKFEQYEIKIINYIFAEQRDFMWCEIEEIKQHLTVKAKDGAPIKFPFTHFSTTYVITALTHYFGKLDDSQKLKLKASIVMLLGLQGLDGKFRMRNQCVPIDYTFSSSLSIYAISFFAMSLENR